MFSASHLLLSIHTDLLHSIHTDLDSFVTEHSYRLTWRRSAVLSSTDLLGGVSFVTEHSYRLTWRRSVFSAVCSGGDPQCVSFVTEHSYRLTWRRSAVCSTDLLGGGPSHLLLSIHTDLLGGGPQCVLFVSFVTEHSYRLTWRRSAVCSLRLICY